MDAANKIKDKGLARKLTTAVVGAIVMLSAGLVIIAAVVFTDIKATMKEVLYDVTLDSYKSVISSEVQSAISITENYYELAQSGGLSEAEAQKSGAVFAALGFICGIYTIIKKFVNPAVPMGFSSTMSAIVFIGGMLMLLDQITQILCRTFYAKQCTVDHDIHMIHIIRLIFRIS